MNTTEPWNLSNRGIIDKINKLTKNDRNIAIQNATDIELVKIIKALKGSQYTIKQLTFSLHSNLVQRFYKKITNKEIGHYIKHLLSDKKLFAYVLNSITEKEQIRYINKIQNTKDKNYWNNYLIDSKKELDINYNSTKEIESQKIDQKTEYIRQLNNEISNKENILKQLVIQKEEQISMLEQKIINLQSKEITQNKELQILGTQYENEKKQLKNDILNIKIKNNDSIEKEQSDFESKKEKFTTEINKQNKIKTTLLNDIEALRKEKEIQISKSLKLKIPEYVNSTINTLLNQEKGFNTNAKLWNIFGITALSLSIVISIISFYYGLNLISNTVNLDWRIFIYLLFKGLIIIAIFIVFAKYSFNVAGSYTHEALKRNERIHAIKFGKLFLEVYDKEIDQNEMKDIFSNWTIDIESSFSKHKNVLDEPKILEYFKELSKILQKN